MPLNQLGFLLLHFNLAITLESLELTLQGLIALALSGQSLFAGRLSISKVVENTQVLVKSLHLPLFELHLSVMLLLILPNLIVELFLQCPVDLA